MPGGFGSGGFGGVPWGGFALEEETSPSDFDVFCFAGLSMDTILEDPNVTTEDSGGQFTIDVDDDLRVMSGGGVSTDTAVLEVTTTVTPSRTLETTLFFDTLPTDFTNLAESHIFIGTTSASSSCAGFFISQAGIAYVGGVHYSGSGRPVVIDSTLQVIPGSSAYVGTGRYIIFRIAINETTGTVYLYVTDKDTSLVTGQVLRAILPVIDASDLAFPPVAATIVSGRGTALASTNFRVDELCLSTHVLVANLAPIADAGADGSTELCSVIQLNGSASFDPEGSNLLYIWRLIEAPPTSSFSVALSDGQSFPVDLSGFTTKFYSTSLGSLVDPALVGDVILLDGEPRSIAVIGSDGHGFFVQFLTQDVPDSLTSANFKLLRQRGLYHLDQVIASFMPDVAGFYRFDLTVSDGFLFSAPAVVVFNVLEAILPRGVIPDVSFLFALMSDFWGLVEDRDRITTLWSGIAQVVAGEMLTLWQHDYAKSLRDIQRQFIRKWLHYDLLLPEPIPELTTLRALWGGLYSTVVSGTFTYSYGNTSITIVSPALATPADIIFPAGASGSFPSSFAADLNTRLQRIDNRFSVRATTWSGSKVAVVIYAPFPFQIQDSTLPLVTDILTSNAVEPFTTGAFNPQPGGTTGADNDALRSGVAIGTNTYRVFSRIDLFGVTENDFLCIGDVAYRVAKLIPDPGGNEQVDIVLKETLPTTLSRTWKISSYISSQLLDFWNGLVSTGDVVSLEIAESNLAVPSSALQYQFFSTVVLGSNEALPNYLPIDLTGLPADPSNSSRSVQLATVTRRRYIPVSSLLLDVPTLSANIVIGTEVDEEAVLRRNIDYTIEPVRNGTGIHFVTRTDGSGLDVWEDLTPPPRLWAEFSYLDNRPTIEANFGVPVEFTLDQLEELPAGLDYLSAVRGLWYAYFNGPTLKNLRIGTQILLGLPFAEENGVIDEIRTDFSPTLGRLLIRDSANSAIVRSYTYPRVLSLEVNLATGESYVVGDSVVQFAPLIEGASIVDYVKDPKWFNGILNQGVFFEVEKYFRFLVQVDSAAFNLSALLAVRSFVLKVKPTFTYPMIVVESGADRVDDIGVDDERTSNVTLNLIDNPCDGYLGSASVFDDYRAAGGHIRNQFDSDPDPNNPPPTFPTSDTPILWAFDKPYLCPEDSVVANVSTRFATSGSSTTGMAFISGSSYTEIYKFLKSGATITVPASPSSLTVPPDVNDATAGIVATAGTLVGVDVRTKGTVGAAPNNTYVVFVDVNGVPPAHGETFSMTGPNGVATVTLSTPLGVSPSDVVTTRVQVGSGSARVEAWTFLELTVIHSDTPSWTAGDVLAPGTYRTTRQLSP